MQKIISTWIYLDAKNETSQYPQIGGDSSSSKFQAVYWRCVVVFFETSLRYNHDCRHILFTNTEQLPVIDGFDVGEYLRENDVEVICIKNKYPLPQGYFAQWLNQFFVFSILDLLSEMTTEEDKVLILDSDCVFRKPADEAFNKLGENEALTYVIRYDENRIINGINRQQMRQIFADWGLQLNEVPWYSGGEAVIAKGSFVKKVAHEFPELYKDLLRRHEEKEVKLNEEAHTLTYFYYKYPTGIAEMNEYIQRLWTNPYTLRTVKEKDRELMIWHLPKEKTLGFKAIFDQIAKGLILSDMSEGEFQQYIYDQLMDDQKHHTFKNKFKGALLHLKNRLLAHK